MVHCTTVVKPGVNIDVLFSLLDPEDPFEWDHENEPHLVGEPGMDREDVGDVWTDDPEFYEDDSEGSADWLMVGQVPGDAILVVPIAQAQYSGYAKVRPITIFIAPPHVADRYRQDKGWKQ